MEKVAIPETLRGPFEGAEDAVGPFVAERNDGPEPGARLFFTGDEYVYINGYRAVALDDTYTVEVENDTVTFVSDRYWSRIVLRPMTLEDAAWLFPDETYSSLEELMNDVLIALDGRMVP